MDNRVRTVMEVTVVYFNGLSLNLITQTDGGERQTLIREASLDFVGILSLEILVNSFNLIPGNLICSEIKGEKDFILYKGSSYDVQLCTRTNISIALKIRIIGCWLLHVPSTNVRESNRLKPLMCGNIMDIENY